jgi:hypothetical protein
MPTFTKEPTNVPYGKHEFNSCLLELIHIALLTVHLN